MKRFYIKTFIFIFPIFILSISFEFALSNIPNDYSFKKAYLDQNSNQIETLILGSSHAFYGLDPSYFNSKTFNAAYVSQTLDYDEKIFKKYAKHMSHLRTVIIPVSYFSLYEILSQGEESWRAKNYMTHCNISSSGFFDKVEVLNQKLPVNIKKFVGFYVNKKSYLTCSELGWGNLYKSEESKDLDVTGKDAAKRHTKGINTEIEKKMELIMDSLVSSCESKNINVLLITLPAYESYRENLNTEYLKMTIDIVNDIAQRHKNCTFVNMLTDPFFFAEDFFDGDHLNDIGAKKLSLMVNRIIEELNK